MSKRSWSDSDLRKVAKTSRSVRQCLIALGLRPIGGNYKTVKNHLERLNIDTNHFTGQGWSAGKKVTRNPAIPLNKVLVKDSRYSTSKLKLRLIKEGLLEPRCSSCGLKEWQGKPLTLHLDHRNGVNNDHRLKNLRLLCPNCHSQTNTYAGRNNRRKKS